jgi:alkyldihydroxyacetonephosphate synthase
MDMGRLNRLLDLNEKSRIATFNAGVAGPEVESQLRAKGYTLGHFPQSFEYSTLGGWVATRSSGQQSLKYGRIEQMFAGGRLETPAGPLEIVSFPASAAGPDLREVVLGSEGRLGLLTEIKLRVSPLPEEETFRGIFFPAWKPAFKAVRMAVQKKAPLSMLRLSGSMETETQLILAGHRRLISNYERWLSWRGAGKDKCLLMFGVTGTRKQCRRDLEQAAHLFGEARGFTVGKFLGQKWFESRFKAPYLRNSLWEKGYAVDTLETATDWQNVDRLLNAVEHTLHRALEEKGEKAHVFSHLSHFYPQGASIYTTFIFRIGRSPENTLSKWEKMKTSASRVILSHGGTISHQHGVGKDHAPYLPAEKGELGMEAIRSVLKVFDPEGMMNPGKLVG